MLIANGGLIFIMAVTIKKIAELAGVSAGTVDRVLNKRGKVKPEIQKRIESISKALNYKPNSAARGLALCKKTIKIGIVSHVQLDYINYAVNECYKGTKMAEAEYSDFGFSFLYSFSKNFDVNSEVLQIDSLLEENISILAITPINDLKISNKLDEVIKKGIPVFCFINDIVTKNKHYYIGINNYKAGCIAAGLFNLLKKEQLNIAVVSPSLSLMGNSLRLKGFEDIIKSSYQDSLSITSICIATNDNIESYNIIKEMLDKNPHTNAIFFASGAAKQGMKAINESAIKKPLIIAIDSSDVIRNSILNGNIMATINQNTFEAGYRTIKIIYDYIMFGYLPESASTFIDCEIMIKEHFI